MERLLMQSLIRWKGKTHRKPYLYPLNFREYLMAIGEKELVNPVCRQDYTLINAYHSKYTDLLRRYYYVGGMPEAVQTYIDTEDMGEVRKVQKQLLLYYENDFSKHAPKEQMPRIQMVWNSIPAQLAKENRKFIYGIDSKRHGIVLLFDREFFC